jgi:hypothetical protein
MSNDRNDQNNQIETIKELRFQAGLRAWQVSAETGISLSRLSAMERGLAKISADDRQRIVSAISRLREAKAKVVRFALESGYRI